MSLWPYSGTNSEGMPVKGKVVADDINGAKERLANMGVKWDKLGDEESQAVNQRPPPPPPVVKEQVEGAIKSFQMTAEIPRVVPPRPPPVLDRPSTTTKKRQHVLFGSGDRVKSEAKPLLDRGGRVIHALMSPDASGRPQVCLVIEAEEES